MKQRKGFTLIELLAVIVILAVIALIATPIIIGIINDAKEKANENSAYGIIDSANYYFTNGMLKEGSVLYNTNILNSLTYNGQAPKEGSAVYVNEQGQVAVALLYGDKCYKKEYNDSKISLGDIDNCSVNVTPIPTVSLSDTLKNSTIVTSGSGLYKTTDTEYRFRGGCTITGSSGNYTCSDPDPINNYISINGHKYRIISMDTQGIKVITENKLEGNIAYDKGHVDVSTCTAETCPRNNAENTFCRQTTGTYYGCSPYISVNGTFAAGTKTGTVTQNSTLYEYLNNTATDSNVITLRNTAIDATWNVGAILEENTTSLSKIRQQEQNVIGSFKMGLLNVSDYIAGSLEESCERYVSSGGNSSAICRNQNWLYNSTVGFVWTINPWADNINNSLLWVISSNDGYLSNLDASFERSVRPVAYLPLDVQVVKGTGTQIDPWVLQ